MKDGDSFLPLVRSRTFLVTGGAGFIGSHIADFLVNHQAGLVRILDDFSTGFINNLNHLKGKPGFEIMKGSIADFETCRKACSGIEFISHQAALGSVPRSFENPMATHEINASGFLNMIIAANDNKVRRMVFASSSSVYGDDANELKLEGREGHPLSPYAVSKITNELYAKVLQGDGRTELIGLRYFNVFGPRQSPNGAYAAVIPLFFQQLIEGKDSYINGDGNQVRDFTFVENTVLGNMLGFFAPSKATGQVYNIAMGNKISVNDLHRMIAKTLGKESNPVYRQVRKGDVMFSSADISLASQALGYKPVVSFEAGIQKTADWFLSSRVF